MCVYKHKHPQFTEIYIDICDKNYSATEIRSKYVIEAQCLEKVTQDLKKICSGSVNLQTKKGFQNVYSRFLFYNGICNNGLQNYEIKIKSTMK